MENIDKNYLHNLSKKVKVELEQEDIYTVLNNVKYSIGYERNLEDAEKNYLMSDILAYVIENENVERLTNTLNYIYQHGNDIAWHDFLYHAVMKDASKSFITLYSLAEALNNKDIISTHELSQLQECIFTYGQNNITEVIDFLLEENREIKMNLTMNYMLSAANDNPVIANRNLIIEHLLITLRLDEKNNQEISYLSDGVQQALEKRKLLDLSIEKEEIMNVQNGTSYYNKKNKQKI